jgi:hypothetical protein
MKRPDEFDVTDALLAALGILVLVAALILVVTLILVLLIGIKELAGGLL